VIGNETIAAITKRPRISGDRRRLGHFAGLAAASNSTAIARTVTSYLQILTPHPTATARVPNPRCVEGFRIHRVAANRWELSETAEAGKSGGAPCAPSNGTEPPRDILRGALKSFSTEPR
jgi:hypothetical protein